MKKTPDPVQLNLFEDMPLTPVKKKRKPRKSKKKKPSRRRRAMSFITDCPLWKWQVKFDFSCETADTFRNIIREYFYMRSRIEGEWTEEELIDYVRAHELEIPVQSFIQFWNAARASEKGKLGWIKYYKQIKEEHWTCFTRILAYCDKESRAQIRFRGV